MGMLYEIIRIPDEVRKELLREPYGIYKLLDIEPQPEMPPLPQKKKFSPEIENIVHETGGDSIRTAEAGKGIFRTDPQCDDRPRRCASA